MDAAPTVPPVAPPLRRTLVLAGSPLAVASFAVPLLAAVGWGLAARGDPWVLVEGWAFRAWTTALVLALVAAGSRAALERRWASVAVAAGAVALALQPQVTTLWRFQGTASVGEGETVPRWRTLAAGPFGVAPELGTVEFDEGTAAVTLRVGDEGLRLLPGRAGTLRGVTLTLEELGAAPSFRIRAQDGTVTEEGLIELSPHDTGYIEVASLPHRFYFTAPPGPAAAELPRELRLRIQRGRLKLLDRVLAPGEEASFEGLRISWDQGARWALLDVRSRTTPYLAAAGLALIAEGALAAWLLGRKR